MGVGSTAFKAALSNHKHCGNNSASGCWRGVTAQGCGISATDVIGSVGMWMEDVGDEKGAKTWNGGRVS